MKKRIVAVVLLCVMLVCAISLTGCQENTAKTFKNMEDFNKEDVKLGILASSNFEIQTRLNFPNAQKFNYDTVADLILALEGGKIDGFLFDKAFYSSILWEKGGIDIIGGDIPDNEYGYIIADTEMGLGIKDELNAFITEFKTTEKYIELQEKWFSGVVPDVQPDYESLQGTNGVIKLAVSDGDSPMSFMLEGKIAGFDIDVITLFAEKYGYALELEYMDFDAILASIKTGKHDLAMSGITITEERKEEYTFSETYCSSEIVMVLRETDKAVEEDSLEHYKDAKLGYVTGTVFSVLAPKLLPDAEFVEFNSSPDALMALDGGKIDGFPSDASLYYAMLWEGKTYSRVKEPLSAADYGVIFGKNKNLELQSQFNTFLAQNKDTLADLEEKWFNEKEPAEFLTYDDLTGENGTLRVGTSTSSMPFVYMKNGKLTGFDIDLLILFAREYGYKLDLQDTLFASVLTGVSAGTYDVGVAGFTITEERAQSVDFSDVYHKEELIIITKGKDLGLSQFSNAQLGVVTGSLYGGYSKEQFPNATINEFNNFADVLMALKQGKVSGTMLDKPNFNSVKRTDSKLSCVNVPAYSVEIGFGFQKNDGGYALQAQMNEFLDKLRAEDKLDAMIDKWYGETEPNESVDLSILEDNSTKLKVSIDTTRKPFVYMYEGKPVGFEIEVLAMFCEEYDYSVEIEDVSFASGLAGLAGEKYDLVCGGLYMTEERKESVNFSTPYMVADVVMATYERNGFQNFVSSFKESFNKTFVREARWKLILEGIIITLIISLFAVLGGTLLGFLLYLAARAKNKKLSVIIKAFAKVYSKLIEGTPTLVVLMILFYCIFGKSDINGILVAIIGFILTFGSFVYGQLDLTVDGVDKGQTEAAYALGYSRNKTFFRIILPQAMKMFVPVYSAQIIDLIKATSVVGYIAVNDLTKMGDIIRSNTYEAFFPLIAVAVIYFILTWGVSSLLGILRKKTEPKRRKNKDILKGVVR